MNDRLIEVNGTNVEDLPFSEIRKMIGNIKYPEPLQFLVASAETYDYYKESGQPIHSGLPQLQKPSSTGSSKTFRFL